MSTVQPMPTTKVPFLDLLSHHRPHREEFLASIAEVIDTGAFAGGRFVDQFEKEFADYCDAKFAIGVANGTDALWLALLALGVGPGDEVITVPATFIATAEAITYCGATPVFVDVDEQTYNMDPQLLEAAITPKTKAIIPVHLFGQMADMDPILAIANAHGIPVVEDSAQGHGARNKGRRAGSLGAAGCFSFYPGKNLGAFGEGGAVVTDDEELATRIRMFRDHGQEKKYHHKVVGWNCRLDGIQGAVLSIKLRHLDANNQLRRDRAAQYGAALRVRSKGSSPRTVRPTTSTSTTSTPCASPTGMPSLRRWAKRASRVPSTTQSQSTCSKPTRISPTRWAISQSPSAAPASSYRCQCSQNSPPIRWMSSSRS